MDKNILKKLADYAVREGTEHMLNTCWGKLFSVAKTLIRIFLVQSSFCDDLRIRATVMPHIHLGKRSSTESFSCRTSPRQFDFLPTLLKKDLPPDSIRWESSSIVARLSHRTSRVQ